MSDRVNRLFMLTDRDPTVLNRMRLGAIPDTAVYVGRGRGSRWGNPYKLGPRGEGREEAIAKFETYARNRLKEEPDWLAPLRGKDLVCHCAPKPCHAEVLLKLIKERYE